jgi:hypothetical protein
MLAACQQSNPPQPVRFSKPGATDAQFQKDRYACIQQARTPVSSALVNAYGGGSAANNVYVDRGTLMSCLAARGYSVRPDGEFAAPPGSSVTAIN